LRAGRPKSPIFWCGEKFRLVSYATNYYELFRRAAALADKIRKGSKPGELPVEQPTKFELVVNLKTAKAIDLTIPAALLSRADEVIE
jgi:putative ABC transport system substrate-binding protein